MLIAYLGTDAVALVKVAILLVITTIVGTVGPPDNKTKFCAIISSPKNLVNATAILLSSLYILPSKHHINSNYYLHADDS